MVKLYLTVGLGHSSVDSRCAPGCSQIRGAGRSEGQQGGGCGTSDCGAWAAGGSTTGNIGRGSCSRSTIITPDRGKGQNGTAGIERDLGADEFRSIRSRSIIELEDGGGCCARSEIVESRGGGQGGLRAA